MPIGAALWVFGGTAAPVLLLAVWRFAYPRTPLAWIALVSLVLLAGSGAYRTARLKRRAVLAAVLVPDTLASRLLQGRIVALLGSFGTVAVLLPAVSYFALTAHRPDVLLALGMAAVSPMIVVMLLGRVSSQVQPAFASSIAARWAGWVLAATFGLFHALSLYHSAPTPEWCAGGSLAAQAHAGMQDLPDGSWPMAELFALFRAAEVLTWCGGLPGGLELPRAMFITVQSGLVFFGLAAMMAGCQMLALRARSAFVDHATDGTGKSGSLAD